MRKAALAALLAFAGLTLGAAGQAPRADVRFFAQAMPAASLTTAEPAADTTALTSADFARYYACPSVLNFGLEAEYGPASLVFRVDIRPDFNSFATERYYTNLPFAAHGISSIGDANMPTMGYFSYEGERLAVSIGRRQLAWGPGTYGLAIGIGAPYLEHLQAAYSFPSRSGEWRYSFVAIGADRAGEAAAHLASAGYKNIFAHRVGYESDRLRVGVGELNLIHDIVPSLIDISPFGVYHNLYEDSYSNVMLDASAEWLAMPGLRAYGEFVMDDLVMPWEENDGSPFRPTAIGYMVGAEWRLAGGRSYAAGRMREGDYALRDGSFAPKGGLILRYEHYRTSTYLYNREIDSGKWTLPDHRLVNTSTGYLYTANAYYLGFPYGPGVRLHMLSLDWESAALKATLALKYLSSGGRGIDSTYPPSDGAATWFALQDPVTKNFIAYVGFRAAFSEATGIFASGEVWIGDSPGAAATLGLEYRFSTPSR